MFTAFAIFRLPLRHASHVLSSQNSPAGATSGPDLATSELAQAEARVEAHSASLKKELGVRDLALTQILFIVGLTWIGVAGKLGSSHVLFWLAAIVLFYLPSAAVVMYLNRLMPLEGGLYQWAKLGFNQTVGFMLAWNLWLYVIVFTSEIGVLCATYLSYAIGPSAAWMTTSNWFAALAAAVILSLMVVASTIGLSVGKWVHNVGGVMMLIIFGALFLLPVLGLLTGRLREYHPFRTSVPSFSLYNLNILGKMGFGALGGFEYIAILAGETRAPARSVGRSVLIAAPIIALMFVLGTSTVVAYIPTNDIDLVGPLPQVLRAGFGPFGIAGPLVTIAILMTLGMRVAQASVSFTAVTRLPMVAGWDRLLPPWFSRLHSKYKTPVNSIVLVGACSFGIGLLSLIGVGQAEAFQLVFNASGMLYALTYIVMFAIPIFGLRGITPRPPLWLKVVSMSGLLMTVLYFVLSVFPIIKVESVTTFALKISLVIVMVNLVGIGILVSAKRRSRRVAVTAA
jgi:amino acid transporter